jgi:hypothetical protein
MHGFLTANSQSINPLSHGPPGFPLIRRKIVQFSTRIDLPAGRTFLADVLIAMDPLSISAIVVTLAVLASSAMTAQL